VDDSRDVIPVFCKEIVISTLSECFPVVRTANIALEKTYKKDFLFTAHSQVY